jgi:hypothetical protein
MTNSETLRAFMDRVWSGGDVSAVDEYLASTYTIFSDPGDPGTARLSTATRSSSV